MNTHLKIATSLTLPLFTLGCSSPAPRTLTIHIPSSFSGEFWIVAPRNIQPDPNENVGFLRKDIVLLRSGISDSISMSFMRGGERYGAEWVTGSEKQYQGKKWFFFHPSDNSPPDNKRKTYLKGQPSTFPDKDFYVERYYFGTFKEAKKGFYE